MKDTQQRINDAERDLSLLKLKIQKVENSSEWNNSFVGKIFSAISFLIITMIFQVLSLNLVSETSLDEINYIGTFLVSLISSILFFIVNIVRDFLKRN